MQGISLKRIVAGIIVMVILVLLCAIIYTGVFIAGKTENMIASFTGYRDDYMKQISLNVSEQRKVMGILGVKNDIKVEVFKQNVTQSQMILIGKRLGRIINETLIYYFQNNTAYEYSIYGYLPPDGNTFKDIKLAPLERIAEGTTYDYSAMQNGYYITFWGQINNFMLNDGYTMHEQITDGLCYQELRVRAQDVFNAKFLGASSNLANIYIFDKNTGNLVYKTDNEYAKLAGEIYTEAMVKNTSFTGDNSVVFDNERKTVYSVGTIDNINATLVFLYNTPMSNNLTESANYNVTVVVFVTTAVVMLLMVLSAFYLIFANKVARLIKKIDKYGEQANVYVQTFRYNDEVSLIDKHLERMHNKIVTLLQENFNRKYETIKAHNEALIASINPHFLYNTLNSINSMATIEGAEDTSHMIEALSGMFRYITSNQVSKVTLFEEMVQIQNYILIQKNRYRDEFEFITDITNDTLKCIIPKFILQPIVENFFKHGFISRCIRYKVIVSAKLEGADLLIDVYDNGKGIDEPRLLEIQSSLNDMQATMGDSVGLKNVNNRIRYMYGEGYGVTIRSKKDEYTVVTMRLKVERE